MPIIVYENWCSFYRALSPGSASTETISLGGSTNASRTNSLPRPTSPSPSVVSEKTEAELQVIFNNHLNMIKYVIKYNTYLG
jgi:hypothetical protein